VKKETNVHGMNAHGHSAFKHAHDIFEMIDLLPWKQATLAPQNEVLKKVVSPRLSAPVMKWVNLPDHY